MTTNQQSSAAAVSLDRDDFIVVSNRQPYRHTYDDAGEITVDCPAGGLTIGLDPVVQRTEGTWIAWGDGDADTAVTDDGGRVRVPPSDPAYTLQRVWLSDEQVENYYYGYSNRVLWPLCHGFASKVTSKRRYWTHYRAVNERFADHVVSQADDQSAIWFQDYHFTLAPRLVREQLGDDAFLFHFYHIPWPNRETFRECDQRYALLDGLLANDLLGFHTTEHCTNFLDCVGTVLPGAEIDWPTGTVTYNGQRTTVRAFPMGVQADVIADAARSVDGSFWPRFKRDHGIPPGGRVALGIDRLDYTKGIPERLEALERFWERYPEWRGELTYVQKATESRSSIPEYQALSREVFGTIDRINERFGTDDWRPIVCVEAFLSREELFGLCRFSDLALVSPHRDGMNLVAKEYVASQVDGDGVLVLSEGAGAAEQLADDAVVVTPTETDAFADAIKTAVELPEAERRDRMTALRTCVADADLDAWMSTIFETVREIDREPDVVASNASLE
ncbi:alpha,alpha-trehalose-phosphate synthase (UDP-forming) [Haloferacaceae archaeon DSL9]